MRTKTERLIGLLLSLLMTFLVIVGVAYADDPSRFKTQRQRFKWIVTKRLTVENQATFNGLVELNNELHVDNSQDSVALNVQGHSTQTSDLFNLEDSDSFDRFDVTNEGHTRVAAARDAATGYDYFLTVTGTLNGLVANAKTYGQYIEVNRPLGSSVQHGNIDDAGLKIRVDTDAITTTAGYVLNGADIQAKTDNNAMQPTLRGAQITADTDASSYTDYAYGLRVYVEGEGMITTTMQVADFELSRKQATDPTNEYGLNIRNTSTAGGGADVALRIESSYGAGGSAADDNWDYLIDLSPADAAIADLRFSQGETVDNLVDGVLRATGDISVTGALTVQNTSDLQGDIYDSIGDVTIDDGLLVTGDTVINSNLHVTGTSELRGYIYDAVDDIDVRDNITVAGNVDISGALVVTGTSDLRGAVSDGAGDLMLNDDVNVSGNLDVDTNLAVTGTSEFFGYIFDGVDDIDVRDNITVAGNVDISGGLVVTGTSDLRGAVSDGAGDLMLNDDVNVSSNLDVDGNLVVTGTSELRDYVYDVIDDLDLRDNVTLTGNLDVSGGLVVTGTSELRGYIHDAVDDIDVRDSITVAGDVDIVGNLAVTGTSNLQGNLRDELGALTVADNVIVDGQADAIQLIVQGNGPGAQSSNLFVAEESGGTDMFSIGPTGNTFISGTLDVRGAVSDGADDLDLRDNVTLTGNLDVSGNLVVTGTSELRGYVYDSIDDLDLRDNVTVTGNVDISGGLVVTGATQLRSTLDVWSTVSDLDSDLDITDDVTVTGDVDIGANLTVTGTSDFLGNVSDSQGDLTFADTVTITEDLTVGDTVNYDDRVYNFSGAQGHTPTESMFIGDPTAADLILTLQTGSAEEGDFLYIVNIHATNCITIVDTTATAGGGDRRLDKDDVIGFIYAGAAWVEAFFSDNS